MENFTRQETASYRQPFSAEPLEPRRLLSAVPQAVLDEGFEPMQWRGQEIYAKPGQWIVQLSGLSGSPDAQLDNGNRQLGRLNSAFKASRHLGQDGLLLVNVPRQFGYDQLHQSFSRLGNFRYLEPDGAVWTTETLPNDPYLATELWGLHNTGQTGGTAGADIDTARAWDLARGDGSVVVGVIDTGIDYKHPDLAANVWINTAEANGRKNVDDDGNGYKDDIYGYDFYNNDPDPMDDSGHGTHVAGTIAAVGNNGIGVVGVNWNAKVMAIKFLGASGGGSWSGAVAAINYATMMSAQHNIKLTNNSYGGWEASQILYEAIERNRAAGMLFVAAAGNSAQNVDNGWHYPAGFHSDNIISVAATDHNDDLATFSNYGPKSVELAAPGVNILSTMPRNSYAAKNGTSMAAPHVAGVAALAWSYAPNADYQRIRAAVLRGVNPKDNLAGIVGTGGRLNAYNTLARVNDSDFATPADPFGLTATAVSASQIDLTWQHDGIHAAGFKVYRSIAGGEFVHLTSLRGGWTRYRDAGLSPGTEYTYRVTAHNFVVESGASESVVVATPQVFIPNAPTNLVASAVSNTQIKLTWSDNSGDELGFKVERSTDANQWTQIATLGANATSFTNGGLKRNATYYYRVRAYNEAGDSDYSNIASARTSTSGQSAGASAAPAPAHPFFVGRRTSAAAQEMQDLLLPMTAASGGSFFSELPVHEEDAELTLALAT